MRLVSKVALAAVALVAAPALADPLGVEGVSLTTTPTVFNFDNASFAFTYDAALAAAFDYMPYSVQTSGTGETSAFGGFLGIPLQPSPFDQSGIVIDGNLFPSYASFPDLTPIPYSLVAEDLALRYMVGADYYYGFARLNGDGTLNIAFESNPNTAIIAGTPVTGPFAAAAVPEPATWAMMLIGFGAVGVSMRRRRRATLSAAIA